MGHIIHLGDFSGRLTGVAPWPACALNSSHADQLALKLGQTAQDGEHQAAVGLGGIGPCIAPAPETGLFATDQLPRREETRTVQNSQIPLK